MFSSINIEKYKNYSTIFLETFLGVFLKVIFSLSSIIDDSILNLYTLALDITFFLRCKHMDTK